MLVGAVVERNGPSATKSKRAGDAMRSLGFGPGKRGRSKRYDRLVELMVERYFAARFGFADRINSLDALAEVVLAESEEYAKATFEELHNARQVLRKRFKSEADHLLALRAADADDAMRDALMKVRAAALAIAALGVDVEIPPAIGAISSGAGGGGGWCSRGKWQRQNPLEGADAV